MEIFESEIVVNAVTDDKRRNMPLAIENVVAPPKERRHAEFFDVINASLSIRTPEQFCAWAQGDLQHVFPHGMLMCSIGMMENEQVDIKHLISYNFPREYLQNLHEEEGLNSSPVLTQWLKHRRPVIYQMAEADGSVWQERFNRFDLRNIAAHGQSDLNHRTSSYFSFSRIPGKLTIRHARLLEMLVPHMHVALLRAIKGKKKVPRNPKFQFPSLTGRELEVLKWLGTGKTNWEIAQVLSISENTVKNHVQRLLFKLKANTRAQAVALGLEAK